MRYRNVYLVAVMLLLVACTDGQVFPPWNKPHSIEAKGVVTYYGSYSNQPRHLDPARSYSAEEGLYVDNIYEPPLQYHFLKRPYELEPATASRLPEVSWLNARLEPVPEQSDQVAFSVFTLTLKPGTLFQPHPAFALGADGSLRFFFETAEEDAGFRTLQDFPDMGTRELKSDDYIYQIKRLADPKNKSPMLGVMSERIVGLPALTATLGKVREEKNSDWVDLRQHSLEGVTRIDDYTWSIRVHGRYPQFVYWQAMRFFAPIPWEADRFYHNPGFAERNLTLDWYPVGTGPFMMVANDPNREIILQRNPNFREDYYPAEGAPGDLEKGLLKDAGKQLPFVDRIVFTHEKASIPQWAKFLQGYYDRSGEESTNINSATFDQAFTLGAGGMELTPALKDMQVGYDEEIKPSIYYTGFNMQDPVVGGYTDEQRKLRQAISIVWDDQEFVDIFWNGLGEQAHGPIPPGIFGHQAGERGINPYVFDWNDNRAVRKSVKYAQQLMSEAGYPNGRDIETGKPLILYMDTTGNSAGPAAEWRRKQLEKLGVQLEFRTSDYARFREKMRKGNTQIFGWGWLADYPDPENFLFMLDSRQGLLKCECDGANTSNYDNPEYDRLLDEVRGMSNTPERQQKIDQMIQMVRKDTPWIWGFHIKEFYLRNQWVSNTKRHGIAQGTLKYVNVDPPVRKSMQQQWNQPVIMPLLAGVSGFIALLALAVRAYRRRQNSRIVVK